MKSERRERESFEAALENCFGYQRDNILSGTFIKI